jgi:hypothetical protein
MKYTSLEFNKKLAEVGFDEESDEVLHNAYDDGNPVRVYDILNDLCVKYAKEVWGEYEIDCWDDMSHTIRVMRLLQQGKQDEVEQYIEENSILFNKEK